MSTDSIVQFRNSDDTVLVALYVNSDTHPETFIPKLRTILDNVQDRDLKIAQPDNPYRLNWNYFVTNVVNQLLNSHGKMRFIPADWVDQDENVIHNYVVIPYDSEEYKYVKNPINDTIVIVDVKQ